MDNKPKSIGLCGSNFFHQNINGSVCGHEPIETERTQVRVLPFVLSTTCAKHTKDRTTIMSEYYATVAWQRGDQAFSDNKYSRGHTWQFDGGLMIPASPSPHIVPVPMSVEENVDPEEAFVASLSSCHMLFFLTIAAKKGFIVDEYVDHAVGVLGKNDLGKMSMVKVTLRPAIIFSGDKQPTIEEQESMHHQAHDSCFIANSVTTTVEVAPQA